MLNIHDMVKCSAHFNKVDQLEKAYHNLISGLNKRYIIKILPQLIGKNCKIIINMGVQSETRALFIPLLGQVELKFGELTVKDTIDEILLEL